jgi:putative ABC transport system permease protein
MEIGPILRALINHRSRFWLITLEIALTLAIVANCVNMVLDQRARMLRPTGIDEANLLVLRVEPFDKQFEDEAFLRATYEEDLRALRAVPGVRKVTAMHAVPLSGGGSSTGRKAAGAEIDSLAAPYFVVGADAIATLGVELVEGRDFVESDFPVETDEKEGPEYKGANVILTRDLADLLYPDGDALGRQIQSGGDDPQFDTVVGIVERMHGSWPTSEVAERVMLMPGFPAGARRTHYLVRAEPGAANSLFQTVEDVLLGVNPGRLVTVRTMRDVKAETYASLAAFTRLLGGLSVLLVVVTSLGIVGLTSFSVTQRTHEIGTRRALGATRVGILRHFLVENWLVTGIGLTLGLVLTGALNFALAHWAEVPRIGVLQIAIGIGVLWSAGLLAALVPALRAMTVSPVIATRNVY